MESKMTFSFDPIEQKLIIQSLNEAREEWSHVPSKWATSTAKKVDQGFCNLDGGEMKMIAAALSLKGHHLYEQGQKIKALKAFSLSGQVQSARVEFHKEWSKKLGGE